MTHEDEFTKTLPGVHAAVRAQTVHDVMQLVWHPEICVLYSHYDVMCQENTANVESFGFFPHNLSVSVLIQKGVVEKLDSY